VTSCWSWLGVALALESVSGRSHKITELEAMSFLRAAILKGTDFRWLWPAISSVRPTRCIRCTFRFSDGLLYVHCDFDDFSQARDGNNRTAQTRIDLFLPLDEVLVGLDWLEERRGVGPTVSTA
jgi:hypothetical protein